MKKYALFRSVFLVSIFALSVVEAVAAQSTHIHKKPNMLREMCGTVVDAVAREMGNDPELGERIVQVYGWVLEGSKKPRGYAKDRAAFEKECKAIWQHKVSPELYEKLNRLNMLGKKQAGMAGWKKATIGISASLGLLAIAAWRSWAKKKERIAAADRYRAPATHSGLFERESEPMCLDVSAALVGGSGPPVAVGGMLGAGEHPAREARMSQIQSLRVRLCTKPFPADLVEEVKRGSYSPEEVESLLWDARGNGSDPEERLALFEALLPRVNAEFAVNWVMSYLGRKPKKTPDVQMRLFALCQPQLLIQYLRDDNTLINNSAVIRSLPSALQTCGLSAEQMNSFFGRGSSDPVLLINQESLPFIQDLLRLVHKDDREKVSKTIRNRVRELSFGSSDDDFGSDSDNSGFEE